MVVTRILNLVRTSLAAALIAGAASADVLVVDSSVGPGTDFSQISTAIAAAAPNDVLLVRSGNYLPFTVDGQKVTVIAEAGANVWANDVVVTNLASNQSALFQGVRFGSSELGGTALSIEDNQGPVTVEDAEVVGLDFMFIFASTRAVFVSNSDSVTFVQSEITTERPLFLELDGGPGLTIVDSTVHLFDCTVTGGEGMSANGTIPAHVGGPGVVLESGSLFAQGSTLRGGDGGGDTSGAGCEDGADGGEGLRLGVAGPTAVLVDSSAEGGAGGVAGAGCTDGQTGAGSVVVSGVLDEVATPARHFAATSPAAVGASTDLTFTGEPGDGVWLLFSATQAPFYVPQVQGVLSPAAPALLFVGVLDGTGQLDLEVPLNPLGGAEVALLHLQGLFYSALDGFLLSSPHVLAILDL